MRRTKDAELKLVIFDLDGTLIDSQDYIVEAQRRAFAALNIRPPSRAASLSIVGLSLREAFTVLAGAEGPVESLSQAYREAWTRFARLPISRSRFSPARGRRSPRSPAKRA
ncbi:HAD hydrolase-like protein [Methylocella sp.]|uniref:HAD hydrolase-like protein n=1 Tax=Methylocella sp. TaxID=1978226 RepID=UPI003C1DBA7D